MNAEGAPAGRPQAVDQTSSTVASEVAIPLCLTHGTPQPCTTVARYAYCLTRKQPMCGGHCLVDQSEAVEAVVRATRDPARLAELVADVHDRIAELIGGAR